MTTHHRHAAPWTFSRLMSMLIAKPVRKTQPAVLSGREATARHLFGEAVQWSRLDLAEYDANPYLQEAYLLEADRRIATPTLSIMDLMISRWHGYTPQQWAGLPALVKVDKRESYFQVQGLAS